MKSARVPLPAPLQVRDLGILSSEDSMSRAEFCLYMLVKLGRIDEDELQAVQEVFDIYDLNNDGTLTDADTVAANTEIDPDYAEDELGPGANDLVIDLSAIDAVTIV